MAKPSTKQGLIDYCFRKLGAPVLEINVDDDQVDDLVDDTIQYFCDENLVSGETAWTMVGALSDAKLNVEFTND